MCLQKILLLACFCLSSVVALSQKAKIYNGGKSMYTRERYNSAARFKGAKAKTLCPIFETSRYPYQGIGIKLGDPFAITYKYYANNKFAVAVDIGKASSGLYNRYFREKFDQYVVTDTFSTSDASIEYYTHKVLSDLIGEVKLLYSVDASKVAPGLQAYLGAGWEVKNTKLQYDYTYLESAASEDEFGRFERTRFTMGPQAVVGIEYAYFKIPISAFMELEYFYDVLADPGWSRIEGGVGLRYIF
ncbi:MAG TPA: hypothetical protein VF141_06570 [Chryseolinea sp.]